MTTRYDEIATTLRSRWKPIWAGSDAFAQVQNAFGSSLKAGKELTEAATNLRASGRFTRDGLNDEIRAVAAREVVPVLRRAINTVEFARSEFQTRKRNLAIPKPDSSDVVAASLRTEMRAWLKSLPKGEMMKVLLQKDVDTRLLQAAVEAPAPMAGLSEEARQTVLDHALRTAHGTELSRIEELADATALAESAVGVAKYQMQQETGFDHQSNTFDQWFATA